MKNIILTSILLFVAFLSYSQAPPPPPPPHLEEGMGKNSEKIKMLKIAFITQELNLTEKEAQAFWPIYNRMAQEREDLRQAARSQHNQSKKTEFTDQEAEKILMEQMEMEQKLLDLDKKYISEFRTVLPASKILKLRIAERDFLHKVLRKIDEKRGREGGKPPHHKPH